MTAQTVSLPAPSAHEASPLRDALASVATRWRARTDVLLEEPELVGGVVLSRFTVTATVALLAGEPVARFVSLEVAARSPRVPTCTLDVPTAWARVGPGPDRTRAGLSWLAAPLLPLWLGVPPGRADGVRPLTGHADLVDHHHHIRTLSVDGHLRIRDGAPRSLAWCAFAPGVAVEGRLDPGRC